MKHSNPRLPHLHNHTLMLVFMICSVYTMGIKVKHFNERSVFTVIVDQSRIDCFVFFRFIFCITQEQPSDHHYFNTGLDFKPKPKLSKLNSSTSAKLKGQPTEKHPDAMKLKTVHFQTKYNPKDTCRSYRVISIYRDIPKNSMLYFMAYMTPVGKDPPTLQCSRDPVKQNHMYYGCLCYLLYQHYVISPSSTARSLWIYGRNSSLFNLSAEIQGE